MNWKVLILVTLAVYFHSVVHVEGLENSSKNSVSSSDSNLRINRKNTEIKYDANNTESEERWKVSQLMSLFKKKRDVAKVIKENPVLAKTLSINPALAKSFQNNLQLSKSFQAVQKDEQVIHKIKSFEKTPAASKLKDSLGKNPRGLTEKFVTKLGAAFHAAFYKSNGVVASVNLGIAFAIGLVLLVTVVGAATLLVG